MNNKLTLLLSSALVSATAFADIITLDTTLPQIESPSAGQYNIVEDLTLTSSNEYILEGFTFVMPGVTLTIQPGTVLRGQPQITTGDVPGSLLVCRGGEINAVGTPSQPIIFTTAADTNRERWESGDTFLDNDPAHFPLPPSSEISAGVYEDNVNMWGALTILGYAPNNRGGVGDTEIAGTDYIEGYSINDERTIYGGILPNDSSGSVAYVSIRHSGSTISPNSEQQGLTLGSVGAGTRLDHIDIYCSGDDGIEIFGGTANLKYFILSYFDDDGLDLDQGYTGLVQFGFIVGGNYTPNNKTIDADWLGEWDGEDAANLYANVGQPFGCPTIYNLTMFGPYTSTITNPGNGQIDFNGFITMKEGFGGNFYNSIMAFGGTKTDTFFIQTSGSSVGSLGIPSMNPQDRAAAGTLNVAGTIWTGSGTAADISADTYSLAFLTNDDAITPGAQKNQVGLSLGFGAANGNLANDQNVTNGLNPVPLSGAVLLPSAGVPVTNTFFDSVNYIGAFAPNATTPLFTTGWTALNIRNVLVDNGAAQSL